MRKIREVFSNEVTLKNIAGYFEKIVTKYGTGAKVDAPKSYLGKKVVVVVLRD